MVIGLCNLHPPYSIHVASIILYSKVGVLHNYTEYSFTLRARFHEQSLFAKYLHAFVSDFQNRCRLKCFNCLSILRNRYNPMKNRYSRL